MRGREKNKGKGGGGRQREREKERERVRKSETERERERERGEREGEAEKKRGRGRGRGRGRERGRKREKEREGEMERYRESHISNFSGQISSSSCCAVKLSLWCKCRGVPFIFSCCLPWFSVRLNSECQIVDFVPWCCQLIIYFLFSFFAFKPHHSTIYHLFSDHGDVLVGSF